MERIRFIQHKGVSILLEDLSNLMPGDEFEKVLETARKIITSQPQNSVLAVMDVTNTHYNQQILDSMKEFVKTNSPYIKASAVVGIQGLLGIGLSAVTSFAARSIKVFDAMEAALDWLIAQA